MSFSRTDNASVTAFTMSLRMARGPIDHATGAVSGVLTWLGSGTIRALATATRQQAGQLLDVAVPAVVNLVLDRIDLTALVLDRVDLGRVIDRAIDQTDVTGIVVDRVDLRRVIEQALDSIDLTQLVLSRVDLNAVIRAADLDEVIDRLPIVAIAQYVVEEIDLPRIIRESTGGVAIDAVDAVRLGTHGADTAVAGWVQRVLPRRRRELDAPGEPESLRTEAAREPGTAGPDDGIEPT